jgi:CRISPR-associated protein Csm1
MAHLITYDIGKFYQRADTNGVQYSKILTTEVKQTESIFCPVYNGNYSHKHVIWTMQFISEDFKSLFNAILDNQASSLATIAAAHHKPNSKEILQLIVQEADRLASGGERVANEGQKEIEGTGTWEDFKTVRLCPILETVGNYDNNGKAIFKHSLPISPIVLEGNTEEVMKKYFPKKYENSTQDKAISEENKANYKKLWEGFTKEVKQISDYTDFNVCVETLLNLLHKYAVTVPSSTTDLPDVSLYDHLKVVSAMAVCLYDYLEDKKRLTTPLEIKNDEQPFLLIGADISGIQSFLYDIISSKAAKNLKGRSFYLQLLTDSIVEKVISELQLFSANVIYASGGNFFVLAPNTEFVKKRLDELEKTITDNLFKEHKTTLGFIIDSVEVSKAEILSKNIGLVWQGLYDKLDVKKKQKNKLQMIDNYALFFNPFEQGGITERDAITGEEFEKGEKIFAYEKDEKDNPISYVKKVNHEQVELGKKLKEFDYSIIAQGNKENYFEKEFSPANLSNYFYFLEQDKFTEKSDKFINYKKSSLHISRFNNLNFLENLVRGNHSYGFSFYGGNKFPEIFASDKSKSKIRYENMPKTFSEMAGQKDEDREYDETSEHDFEAVKFKRLAILRMDVDNLGSLFSSGFNTEKTQQKDKNGRTIYKSVATFSRLASLSRNLDYFFKGFLNVLWESKEAYRNNTQIIYSGGDDLFIVGRWNCIIDFAEDIQTHFAEWTCKNDKIGISGGITIVTPKFPISKAAELCEIDEKLAKNHKISESIEKNAITLFGVPLHWKYEYPIVKELKNRLVAMDIPKSILMKIQAFYQQAKEEQEKNKTQTWRWQMAYNFARAATQYKNKTELLELLSEIKIDIIANTVKRNKVVKEHDYFTLLNLAARWAEFELRSKKQE